MKVGSQRGESLYIGRSVKRLESKNFICVWCRTAALARLSWLLRPIRTYTHTYSSNKTSRQFGFEDERANENLGRKE